MRKILLATTAVVGAAVLTVPATPASAQTAPQVRIGGYINFQYVNVRENRLSADVATALGAGAKADSNEFRTDVEIVVNVSGKAANGLTYGAVIEMEMDASLTPRQTQWSIDEAYIFIGTPTLGQLRLGDEDNAANLLQVRVPTGFGTGGAYGDYFNFLIGATGNIGASYLSASVGDGADNSKISYLSPQFFGFDVGVSWAWNNGEGEHTNCLRQAQGATVAGSGSTNTGNYTGCDRIAGNGGVTNEWSIGARYRGSFGPVGLAVGAGVLGFSPRAFAGTTYKTPRNYNAGAQLTFAGVTVGAEYGWGSYNAAGGRTALRSNPGDFTSSARHFAVGAQYTMGAFTIGANYANARLEGSQATDADRKQRIFGIGGTYALAPGLNLIAEYVNNTFTNDDAARTRTKSNLFILGSRLAF